MIFWRSEKIKNLPIQILDGDRSVRYPKRDEFQSEGVLFLNTTNIEQNRLDLGHANYVSVEKFEQIKKGRLKPLDIVMTTRGSVGKVALFDCQHSTGLINAQMLILRADGETIDHKFLFYILCSDGLQSKIRNFASGSAQPQIPIQDLREIEIEYPDFLTQRKIAAILSAYDDLIENNARRIRIVEEMARLLYREWFVHFRFPGHEGVKVKNDVPEGWETIKLSNLVETQYGYTESASDKKIGPKFLRGMDINKNPFIQWSDVPYCPISDEDYPKYKLGVGDVLIIRMADPGKVGIVEKEIDAVFASYLIRLRIVSPKLSPYCLFYFLLSDRYQGYVTGASTGTTRKSASAGVIVDIDIAIPPAEVRQQFEDRISAIRRMLNNLLEKNNNLRRTRDLLLPKLMSGEVEVGESELLVP